MESFGKDIFGAGIQVVALFIVAAAAFMTPHLLYPSSPAAQAAAEKFLGIIPFYFDIDITDTIQLQFSLVELVIASVVGVVGVKCLFFSSREKA